MLSLGDWCLLVFYFKVVRVLFCKVFIIWFEVEELWVKFFCMVGSLGFLFDELGLWEWVGLYFECGLLL